MDSTTMNPKNDIVDGPFGSNLKATEYLDSGTPIIRLQNIDRNQFVDKNIKFISSEKANSLKRHSFINGDIVITKLGDPLGKACLVPDNFKEGIIVADIVRVRPDERFVSKLYLLHAINSKVVINQLQAETKGTTRARVNLSHIRQIKIPFSPLNEQRRIVDKLERIGDRHRTARNELNHIPKLIARYKQAVLAAACSGKLTEDWREKNPNVETASELLKRVAIQRIKQYEKLCVESTLSKSSKPRKPENLNPEIQINPTSEIPNTWIWCSLKDISSIQRYSMSSGPFGSALGTKDYVENGIPVIRGQNIKDGNFVLYNFVYVSEEKASELERSAAKPEDIVIVAVGSSGNVSIVPQELEKSILSQNCNKFTLDNNFVIPKLILLNLQGEIAKNQMKDKTTDTVRQFLSLTNLKNTLLPIPPLEEQKEIVRRVEKMFEKIDMIEQEYQKAAKLCDRLEQATLAKAFRGELVPQDPDDETASVLLEQVKSQKEKGKIKSKK